MSNQQRHASVAESVRRLLRGLIDRAGMREVLAKIGLVHPQSTATKQAIKHYLTGGSIPWSAGYLEYRNQLIDQVVQNDETMMIFRQSQPLPAEYGSRLDERVVEYPWVFTRLSSAPSRLLDAGSTLNHPFLLSKPLLAQKSLVIYTLAPEQVYSSANVSYIYGDLRETILRDGVFDEIACISTLEHVGMDNTMLYTQDDRYDETADSTYVQVLQEFSRLLKPGGRFLLTVPYGKAQNLGWLQQFDAARLQSVITGFGGKLLEQTFYRYDVNGWQISGAEAAAQCEYFDIHSKQPFDTDYAAAARAVACILMVKQ